MDAASLLARPGRETLETISIREAAERLGVSVKVVRRLVAQGALHAEKTRGRHGEEWRVDAAALPQSLPVSAPSGLSRTPPATGEPRGMEHRAEEGGGNDVCNSLLRDKEFLQRQVEALTALLTQAISFSAPYPPLSGGVASATSAAMEAALPDAAGSLSVAGITSALQSSLRLVEPASVAVTEMCSVRVLWGRPVLWRLLAREEADLAALREAILSPQATWDPPGEEVVFLWMRDPEGAVVWGCACGPGWFGPAFEEALRSARVERV